MAYYYRRSFGGAVFDRCNVLFLGLFAASTVAPFVYVVAASFSSPETLYGKTFIVFPTKFATDAYEYIFATRTLARSLLSSLQITVFGTLANLGATALTAYPLAHADLRGRRYLMFGVLFTMFFSGGMIPMYLLVRSLGWINSYLAVIVPGAINSFNLVVLKSFFQQIPLEMEESAMIDGCRDPSILWHIILPLSAPAMATFGLFYAVGHWNAFFGPMMYLHDSKKWPVQVLLRQIVASAEALGSSSDFPDQGFIPQPITVKMAIIVVATTPILLLYPFLQKHFAKGIMVGSLKA